MHHQLLGNKDFSNIPRGFYLKRVYNLASTKVEIVTDEITSEFSKYDMESI